MLNADADWKRLMTVERIKWKKKPKFIRKTHAHAEKLIGKIRVAQAKTERIVCTHCITRTKVAVDVDCNNNKEIKWRRHRECNGEVNGRENEREKKNRATIISFAVCWCICTKYETLVSIAMAIAANNTFQHIECQQLNGSAIFITNDKRYVYSHPIPHIGNERKSPYTLLVLPALPTETNVFDCGFLPL